MSITSASVGMENALQYKTMLGHTMEVYDAVYLHGADGQYITCPLHGLANTPGATASVKPFQTLR